jgi:hypothetical protein
MARPSTHLAHNHYNILTKYGDLKKRKLKICSNSPKILVISKTNSFKQAEVF